jgi:hypothetical protein
MLALSFSSAAEGNLAHGRGFQGLGRGGVGVVADAVHAQDFAGEKKPVTCSRPSSVVL